MFRLAAKSVVNLLMMIPLVTVQLVNSKEIEAQGLVAAGFPASLPWPSAQVYNTGLQPG